MSEQPCLHIHPEDFGPIQRRCCLPPWHKGPHQWFGYAGAKGFDTDEWEAT